MQVQKINQFYNTKRNHSKKYTFKAGLTKQMKAEISSCDINKIESFFHKNGICTSFNNNKTAAWCILKSFQIIQNFNKKYNQNLGYPQGIFVENLKKLRMINENAFGLTNFAPSYLYKNNFQVVPERTIFFNSNDYNWNNIDTMSDECKEAGINTTDFFLESVLHEFMHVIHATNLLKKLKAETYIQKLQELQNAENIKNFQEKHAKTLRQICDYAAENPMEAIACDLSRRSIKSLNLEKLTPNNNFFVNSPYKRKTVLNQQAESRLNKNLRAFWNGNFY